MATIEQLQAEMAKLQAKAEALIAKQSSTVLASIQSLMDKHGLTTADIDKYLKDKSGRRPHTVPVLAADSAAKYRNPKTGATWSGRGRAPAWIASAKNRERFLVAGEPEVPASTSSAVVSKRVGNYRRGPQPAKYRDPASGATWSGRGRAPAWLAKVRNLDAYLIEGRTEATANVAKEGAAKKAASTKVAAKKTAASKVVPTKSASKTGRPKTVAAPVKQRSIKEAIAKRRGPAEKSTSKRSARSKSSIASESVPESNVLPAIEVSPAQ